MRWMFLSLAFLVGYPAHAVGNCLQEVANFADRICGEIQTAGAAQKLEVDGTLSAEVTGIIRKVLGDAGGEVDLKNLQQSYENVLREDLADELFNARDCRIKMVEVGRAEICTSKYAVPQQSSVSDADIVKNNSIFTISSGNSTSLTDSHRIPFSTYQPAYQGVVGVYINGKRDTMRVGQSRPVPETDCTIWLRKIEKFRGPYSFELRCPR